jgi:myosin heavy subunit
LHSAELATLAMRVSVKTGDPFDTIKGMIDDMIDVLNQQESDDETAKDECESGLAKATEERDALLVEIQKHEATIVQKNMEIKEKKDDNQQLADENSELQKQLQEAADIREKESEQNAITVAEADAGAHAVQQAITALRKVYDALLQKSEAKRTADDPVEGTPTTSYSGDYEGKQDKGNQIVDFLETIKSDFEATASTIEAAEATAASEFDTLKSNIEDQVEDNSDDIKDNEDSIKSKEGDLFDAEADLKDETKSRDLKNAQLERMKPACVDIAINFDKRKEQRAEEISTLNDAKDILTSIAEASEK